MDDVTLSGSLHSVEQNVIIIRDAASKTGFQLNTAKCEIIMEDFTKIPTSSVFYSFVKVEKAEMTLLWSPVLKGKAQDAAISRKIDELKKAVDRLSLLQSHDALMLLKNSLAMPKLLYTLRTSDCSDNTLLAQFDNTLRAALSVILNVDLNDDQWAQASLPVRNGGLGISRLRCWHLQPSWHQLHLHSSSNSQSSLQASKHWQTNPQSQSNSLGLPCQEQANLLANNPAFRKPGMVWYQPVR